MLLKKEETKLHFVGIGGIGMSGIAEVFFNQGYHVSGSDIAKSDTTRRLAQLGIKISIGHNAQNISGQSVVVISSAVRSHNPEVIEARKQRIPVIPRAEMLGELMRGKIGIAVAGTHGKTTTTSMLATVLSEAGLDPTLVIGGKVDLLGGNAKLGQGDLVVAEADESDGSFLHLPATLGVITNVDNDHLDYFGSLTAIEDSFVDFVSQFPFYGLVAICAEDEGVKRLMGRWMKPVVTYGLSREWDYWAEGIQLVGLGSRFSVFSKSESEELGALELQVPGKHNILNALATIAIGRRLHLSFETIAKGLKLFRGVRRRFEIRWNNPSRQIVVVDDYGHHPTEIAATLEAARTFWSGRIVVVFQPHRYSRTLHCHDGFLSAFQKADVLLMTDIYPAGEDPIKGVSSENLVQDLKQIQAHHQNIYYTGIIETTQAKALEIVKEGDLVLCFGAGSITKFASQLVEVLQSKFRD